GAGHARSRQPGLPAGRERDDYASLAAYAGQVILHSLSSSVPAASPTFTTSSTLKRSSAPPGPLPCALPTHWFGMSWFWPARKYGTPGMRATSGGSFMFCIALAIFTASSDLALLAPRAQACTAANPNQ